MDSNAKSTLNQTKLLKQKKLLLNGKLDISLTDILSSENCQRIISESREFRDRIYTPLKTILVFIKQILNPDKSCKHAVAGMVIEHLVHETKEPSSNTGPYCKARIRLPESTIKNLVNELGEKAKKNSFEKWLWRNRNVHIVDGTTVPMPDTGENRETFLRHTNVAGEVAFPLARIVIIISLSVGTIIDYAIGACKGKGTGEHSLLRTILHRLKNGDVLLGDAYYPSFFLIAALLNLEVDGIFSGKISRKNDFRKGEHLGKNDHLVEWQKPEKPDWMNEETYNAYPKRMCVREFKSNGKTYITTLLHHKKYNKNELAKLYGFRWQIEITIRDIKITMNMNMLSCKTPEMIRKEIGTHFLGYNCIRILMAEACIKYNVIPYQISFNGTLQLLNKFMPYFTKKNAHTNERIFSNLLRLIVKNKVGNRPGRLEPRMLKSGRRKRFETLTSPRIIEKIKLEQKREQRVLKYAEA